MKIHNRHEVEIAAPPVEIGKLMDTTEQRERSFLAAFPLARDAFRSAASGCSAAFLLEFAHCGRRMFCEFAGRPCLRPHRTTDQFAVTIRTAPFQNIGGAVATERAFVGTNECIAQLRGQIPVAAFAVRPEFKQRHRVPPSRRDSSHLRRSRPSRL